MHVGEMRSGARQIASIGMTGDDRAVATEALLAAPPKTNAGTGPTKTAFFTDQKRLPSTIPVFRRPMRRHLMKAIAILLFVSIFAAHLDRTYYYGYTLKPC